MRLFIYGTLLDEATLAARGGRPMPAARRVAATLPGWRRVGLRGAVAYPTLRRCRQAQVAGAVIDVPSSVLARLAAWEGDAYRLVRVVVQTGRGNTVAHTWIAPDRTRRPWGDSHHAAATARPPGNARG